MSRAPLTDAELAEGLRLAEAATPGPWVREDDWALFVEAPNGARVATIALRGKTTAPFADASFIAAARDLLPRALAEVQALRSLVSDKDAIIKTYADVRSEEYAELASAQARIGELEASLYTQITRWTEAVTERDAAMAQARALGELAIRLHRSECDAVHYPGSMCTCGADSHNAKVRALVGEAP